MMRILILALLGINAFALASLPIKQRLQSEMDFLRQEAFKEGMKKDLQAQESETAELALEDQYFSDEVSTGLAAPEEPSAIKKPSGKREIFKKRESGDDHIHEIMDGL